MIIAHLIAEDDLELTTTLPDKVAPPYIRRMKRGSGGYREYQWRGERELTDSGHTIYVYHEVWTS